MLRATHIRYQSISKAESPSKGFLSIASRELDLSLSLYVLAPRSTYTNSHHSNAATRPACPRPEIFITGVASRGAGLAVYDATSWRQTLPAVAEQPHSAREDWIPGSHTSNPTKRPPTYTVGRLLCGLSSKPKLLQTEVGSHLFQHFLELVALKLSSRNDPENPWLTLFVPLAMADDLIMSTLLALGGASLCTYSRHALKQACTFYAVILRSMKHRMTELVQGNFSHLVNTLTMIGDSRGVLLYHLQACRELLQLSHRKSITIDPAVLAFILELYLYTSAVGTTFVFDDRPAKLTFDAGYDWLQSLRCGSRGYGFMVGHAGKLIQLLPRLGQTVGRWISQDCDLESSNTDEAFLSFQTELRSWVPSYDQDTKIPNLSDTISDRRPPDEALFTLIDPLIEEFLRLRATLPQESPVWSMMLWPTVMIGSLLNAFNALQQIWDDEQETVFGIVGLSMFCTRQKTTLCLI
uniref:Uncharacterized protein n=1 Tax=Talaromyces marneffei PM1 TaxID=1077442 RepID=A0A093V3P9_TALMA